MHCPSSLRQIILCCYCNGSRFLIVAAILCIVYTALVFVGEKIVGLGVVGVGIYSFLQCLLIPFGLHQPTELCILV